MCIRDRNNIVAGLGALCSAPALIGILLGTIIGLMVGSLPGLNDSITMAVLMPMTFGMDTELAMGLLLGIYCASACGGSIPAILLKIPGTASASVTAFDGYPMAQQGRAGKALGIATMSSWVGGMVSAIVLLTLCPFLAQQSLRFGPPEYFMLTVLGFASVVGMAGENVGKSIIDMFNRENTFNLEDMDRAIGEILAVQEQLLMILNTPANNPTGYSMTKQEMEQTVAILKKHAAANPDKNLTFCLDVSYIDFAGSFEESREIFDAIFDMPANTMTLLIFSMSKSYTMCGMRCGALVCLGSTAESAAVFKQAMSYSSRSTWSNAIHMAQKILVDINLNPEIRERVSQERAVFRNTITNRGRTFCAAAKEASLEICPYQYGYFVAIPCKNPVETARILMDQHIYVVPQAQGLRFSPCTVTTEKCRKAPAFIKAAMEQTQ